MLNGRYSDHVTNWEVLTGLQVPGTMQTVSVLRKLKKKSSAYLSNTSRRCSLTAHKTVPEWSYTSCRIVSLSKKSD